MAQPTTNNYLEASSFAYNSGVEPGLPFGFAGTFMVNTNHYDSKNNYDAFDKKNGFYAAAYELVTGDTTDIVISFEGTNLQNFARNASFSINEIRADDQLYHGQLPNALTEAASFTHDVLAQAARDHISTSNIYLTGHSLGGAEAEYADAVTQVPGTTARLTGTTFGAPGISANYIPSGTTSGLTNYVDSGDPVGNYAYTGPNTIEGAFVADHSIGHYGETLYKGDSGDASQLHSAGLLFGDGSKHDRRHALLDLLGDAAQHHVLSDYASDFNYTLQKPPLGAVSLGDASALKYLDGLVGQQHA